MFGYPDETMSLVFDILPPAVASNSVHLAAMNTGFKSDVGLAVMMHPPID